jgi:hypothetical protein
MMATAAKEAVAEAMMPVRAELASFKASSSRQMAETCKTVFAKLDPAIATTTKLMIAGIGLTIPQILPMSIETRMHHIIHALTQYAIPPKSLVVFCSTSSQSLASAGTNWSEMGNTLLKDKLYCTKKVIHHWRCQPLGGFWILDPAVVDHDQLELAKCEDYFIACTT